MIRALALLVGCATVSAIAAGVVVHGAGPGTAELDADIALVSQQIEAAKAEGARYTGGLLGMEVELRSAILKNTRAMLEQKRTSLLRGITMTYLDPTYRLTPAADEAASAEMAKVREEVANARREAARYSGGLLQVMALAREATARVTLAAIEQRVALQKIGVPIAVVPPPAVPGGQPPGNAVSDKDAL